MSKPCNNNLRKLLSLVAEMRSLADQGDLDRDDPTCGIIYGILRDAAYKLRRLAEEEMSLHLRMNKWD